MRDWCLLNLGGHRQKLLAVAALSGRAPALPTVSVSTVGEGAGETGPVGGMCSPVHPLPITYGQDAAHGEKGVKKNLWPRPGPPCYLCNQC